MNVIEALKADIGSGLGKEVTVSGFLVVSEAVTYLAASEAEQKQAILVIAPWLIEALLASDAPCYVGSMHLFSGSATIKGQLVRSGLALVPMAFYQVSSVSFSIDERVVEMRA